MRKAARANPRPTLASATANVGANSVRPVACVFDASANAKRVGTGQQANAVRLYEGRWAVKRRDRVKRGLCHGLHHCKSKLKNRRPIWSPVFLINSL